MSPTGDQQPGAGRATSEGGAGEGVAPPPPRWGPAGAARPRHPSRQMGGGALAAASLGWEQLLKPASLRSGADSDVGKKEMALPSERAETTTSYNIPPPPDPAKQGS